MKSFAYYSLIDSEGDGINANSREVTDLPVAVNCAGTMAISKSVTTYNQKGRLDYYLMYIREGKLKVYIGDEVHIARPGDFIIFPPKYKYHYTFSGAGVLLYYFAHFSGFDVERLLSTLCIATLPTLINAGHSAEAAEGFNALFSAYTQGGKFRDVQLAVSLERILIALVSSGAAKEKKAPLEHSISYIKTFYTDDIRIPELAAMESLSVSRYNAVFREAYGTSPVKYITNLRLMHAMSLLDSTDLSVKEIGATVGYDDNCFFSKLFKSHIGISPQKYREKNRAQ